MNAKLLDLNYGFSLIEMPDKYLDILRENKELSSGYTKIESLNFCKI